MNTQKNVTLQVIVPQHVAASIDALAEAEAEAAGIGRVTRADVLRRALAAEIAEHAPTARARTRTR